MLKSQIYIHGMLWQNICFQENLYIHVEINCYLIEKKHNDKFLNSLFIWNV